MSGAELDFASLEKLKDKRLQSIVINLIESAVNEATFNEPLILNDLQFIVGEEAANTILSILYINHFGIIEEMEKKKISKEVIDFILELLTKFGNRLNDKWLAENDPYIIKTVQTKRYYLPEDGKTMFSVIIRRNDGKKFYFEVEFEAMCEIVRSLTKAILDHAINVTKNIPESELAINGEIIKEIRNDLQKLSNILAASKKEKSQ